MIHKRKDVNGKTWHVVSYVNALGERVAVSFTTEQFAKNCLEIIAELGYTPTELQEDQFIYGICTEEVSI